MPEIRGVTADFAATAERAARTGFEVAEVHGAHGCLIGEFLSPLNNRRTDGYGGSFDNRARFALDVVDAVRAVWPDDKPLCFRISATDRARYGRLDTRGHGPSRGPVEGARRGPPGRLVRRNAPGVSIPFRPGYQVPFPAGVRREAGLAVAAVGLITDAAQAEKIVAHGEADAALLGRELLRNPSWARHAARTPGARVRVRVPEQYPRSL